MTLSSADLVALLDVEPIGPDRYVARSPTGGWSRIYGGQVIAQSLVAASRTVVGRAPHSLHAYFLLAGDPSEPIVLEVERLRDGRSFSTRRVVARQRDAAIFVLSASYQVAESGPDHQATMPVAPPPEKSIDLRGAIAALGEGAGRRLQALNDRIQPIEFRPIDLPGTRHCRPAPSASRASRCGFASTAPYPTIPRSTPPPWPIFPT